MDLRDLQFWYCESLKLKTERYLEMIQAFRVAQSSDDTYKGEIFRLSKEIRKLTYGVEQVRKEDMDKLKELSSKYK